MNLDIIFVGGGLANTLAAYRLKSERPDVKFLLIEQGDRLGGNHTWSFHDKDLSDRERAWMAPFIARSWPRQEVRFPAHRRMLETGYNSVTSEKLHEGAHPAIADSALLATKAEIVGATSVRLSDGTEIAARCVIDGRGFFPEAPFALGYQKFVGIEVVTAEPHGQAHPIIMDATVLQTDGFRFIYTLPFAPDRILIEDTYYSDTPHLDQTALVGECQAYALRRGWRIAHIERQEKGVLPIVLGGDIDKFWASPLPGVARSGLRAGLFHPTTSYSLPFAVRFADVFAGMRDYEAGELYRIVRRISHSHWRATSFYRLLNRMLFIAAKPAQRYTVLERFYTLSEGLIRRFYAGRTTLADQARILIGRPPITIASALPCIPERAAWSHVARQG